MDTEESFLQRYSLEFLDFYFALHYHELHGFHAEDSNPIQHNNFPIHICSSIFKIFCPSC